MKFEIGNSGGPGRPKGSRGKKAELIDGLLDAATAQRLAQAETKNNIEFLAAVRDNPAAPYAVRVNAASILLDRAYGKPAQTTILTTDRQYVVFAPTPAASAAEWLEQARVAGIDVPTDQYFDPTKKSH
jgi:hypothetical protein